MKAVDLVTIERFIPIFKEGVPANAIEVARVKGSDGESIQYDIVVGKGLHEIGGKGIYIQPDYTIPLNELFLEYHAPFGEPKNSRLGKKGRVRAIKFNLSFEGSTERIYSNGILLPWSNFIDWLNVELDKEDSKIRTMEFPMNEAMYTHLSTDVDVMRTNFLYDINFNHPEFPYQELLGVEKYVADDNLEGSQPKGMTEREFPSFLYKTDEETIQNHRKAVDRCHKDGEVLSFTQKRDGSSITEYTRINPIADILLAAEDVEEFGICSRKWEKKLDQQYVAGYKDGEVVLHKYFHPELKIRGWMNDQSRDFYTEAEAAEKFEPVMEVQKDAWVDTDRKFGYLEKLMAFCKEKELQLCMRGELIGAGNKGSGNKLNSDARTEAHVVWFGVDDLSQGFAKRIHYGQEHNLETICTELGFEYTKELFSGVFSYDEIIAKAHEYFKKVKDETGIIVEGVVCRTKYSNNLSVKILNMEYDSKA
jgi:hypothetical protein